MAGLKQHIFFPHIRIVYVHNFGSTIHQSSACFDEIINKNDFFYVYSVKLLRNILLRCIISLIIFKYIFIRWYYQFFHVNTCEFIWIHLLTVNRHEESLGFYKNMVSKNFILDFKLLRFCFFGNFPERSYLRIYDTKPPNIVKSNEIQK